MADMQRREQMERRWPDSEEEEEEEEVEEPKPLYYSLLHGILKCSSEASLPPLGPPSLLLYFSSALVLNTDT